MPSHMPGTGKHYDVLLRSGEVIDPAQNLRGIRDVAIANGRIVLVEEDLGWVQADQTLDVAGKVVVPGLIDMHAHVYAGVTIFGIDADDLCPQTGVTTIVDAGSAGWVNFPGLKRYVIEPSQTRIMAFVHLSAIGLTFRDGELRNEAYIQPQEAARVVLENPDVALGIKVRLHQGVGGDVDLRSLLRKAVDAAERCGKPLMLHTSGSEKPLAELLPMLRQGDILTHCFNGTQHPIMGEDGRIRPEVWAARDRGVLFDVGHGRGSFSFDVARAALQQGFPPDTISTDVHAFNINGPVYDLPTTMSKFLNLGMDLEEVIERCTIAPARAIGRDETLGSLQVGGPADIAVLELQEGANGHSPVRLEDCHNNVLMSEKRLVCTASLRQGRVWHDSLEKGPS